MSEKESLDTMVGQVADRITTMVLDGVLQPRQKLSEVDFAAKLGVSRNSLREAFRLLIRDGILVHHSHRGVFVRSYEPLEIHDLYEFREFIESAAIAKYEPGDALSEYAVRQMLAIADKAEDAAEKEDWAGVIDANTEFHIALFTLSGNQRAMQLGKDVLMQCRLVFMDSGAPASAYKPFIELNRLIALALERGDVKEAQAQMHLYAEKARDLVLKRWTDK